MSASWVGFCLSVVTLFVGVPLGWALIWGVLPVGREGDPMIRSSDLIYLILMAGIALALIAIHMGAGA